MLSGTDKLFVSYSRENSDIVWKLARDLRKVNVPVWLDQNDIPPGLPWDEAIEAALKSCKGMIVVLTPHSVESREVRNEVNFVYAAEKTIFPCYLEKCDVPYRWQSLNRIDFSGSYEAGFEALMNALGLSPEMKEEAIHESASEHGEAGDVNVGAWGSENERNLAQALEGLSDDTSTFVIANVREHFAQFMSEPDGTIYAEIVGEEYLSSETASSTRAKTLEGLGFSMSGSTSNYAGRFDFDGTFDDCMHLAQLARQALCTAYGVPWNAPFEIEVGEFDN